MSDMNEVTKGIGDLLISDVLSRHGIQRENRRPISEEQKQKIRELVEDLQAQVDQFMKQQSMKTTQVTHGGNTASEPSDKAAPSRRRVSFKRS
ncbi:hypothetical protein NZD89_27570 [Alicyclobacillus fastidiosus]|uniref:Uncharacterized protein n=1 Tax=Alicyclobacillus fastidiosus TaxID=392011 RepID=A0ABY6ZJ29_9BACL|nr:hypothetical protein [Alicyclobacillus fastidiosus]WAH41915.1 hypothetical protein NZD89_27570 [Alicyclobacillus fastidiosus]GMA63630.1 hypothetical protein GCM10025859_40700 [Alicyclobacillus fastidiosus]